jgi:HAD superfamily hydrolase (TIGR01549 family)
MSLSPADFRLIFWDFDGVIKDSVEVKTQAFDSLFSAYDPEVRRNVRAHHETHGGVSRYIKIPHYFQEFLGQQLTHQETERYCQQYSDAVVQAVIDCPWIDGVEEFLRVNPYGQRFVIVTGTPQDEIEFILEKLAIRDVFFRIFGAPYEKPEVLKRVLQATDYSPSECLMIGDSLTDYDAAIANQVPFLLRENEENRERFAFFDGPRVEDFQHWNAGPATP